MVSLAVLSLLDVLHLMLNMRMGGVVALSLRGATVHDLPFMAFVILQRDRDGSLVVVLVAVALVDMMEWIVLTPLWRRCLSTSFTLLILNLMLSHLLTHVLVL
jgi:hypothetical protein